MKMFDSKMNDHSCHIEIKIKGIFSDSSNIFLRHESEDMNKKAYFENFFWFQFYIYKICMIMCIGIAPSLLCQRDFIPKIALIS